jgi:trk system potassium uptake protein TrkH
MRIGESLNSFIYRKQKWISRLLRVIIILVSLATFVGLIYYHGFEHTDHNKNVIFGIIKAFYGFFILNFLLKYFFTLDRWEFIKSNWVETILLIIVTYDVVSHYLFGYPLLYKLFSALNLKHFNTIYTLFIQFYLLILVLIEFVRNYKDFNRLKIKPSTLFVMSFVLLIFGGAFILSLPAMNTTGKFMPFIDALFTATSAGCVTGLSVIDVSTYFTYKGQFIILILMQLGGIGILTFATFFATFVKKGIGLKHENALKSLTDSENLSGAHGLLRPIIFFTLAFEALAAIGIYSLWGNTPFDSQEIKIFHSIFHAVSAFCNAGFSLYADSLHTGVLQHLYILHLMFALTIFFGSLGFPAIKDMFNRENIKQRMAQPWRKWKLSTRIAFFTAIFLVIFGAISFYLLEYDNTLKGMKPVEAAIASIFQSTTTRTAGFNSVNIGDLKMPTIFIMLFLMFIGASSGSTGGGIKTSTFVIIFVALWGIIKGKRNFTLGERNIPKTILLKAFSIFIFSATFVFTMIFLLTFSDGEKPLITIIFETISAFATVGLSMGITSTLSFAGKIIIMVTMFAGRVGLLSLALSLSTEEKQIKYRYPDTHIMIG